MPCRHADAGCDEEMVAAKVAQHEERCPHRPVACPNPGCRERPRALSAASHAALQCRHRPLRCPVAGCGETVAEVRLEAHLRAEHFGRGGRGAPNGGSALVQAIVGNNAVVGAFFTLLLASLLVNWIFFHFYL